MLAPSDTREQGREPVERRPEGRPVLQVHRSTDPFATPGEEPATRAGAERLVPRLDIVEGAGQEPGHRGDDDEVLEGSVVDLVFDPLELGVADHGPAPIRQHPAAAGIDDEHPDLAEIAPVRPHGALGPIGFAVGGLREGPQDGLGVRHAAHGLVDLARGQTGGCEVAKVLVDPVGHEGAGDALLPPLGLLHVPAPVVGRVPVVPDVVIVEDHGRGQRREQPAHGGVPPRLVIEPRVLLEVGDLVARTFLDVPAALDELPHRGRRVVGVDLVAHQDEHIGPALVLLAGHPLGVRDEHVGVDQGAALPLERRRLAAGPEQQRDRPGGVDGPDPAGREGRAIERPGSRAVEPHLIGRAGPGRQAAEHDQGVVVTGDRERPLATDDGPRADLDGARPVGLDPHRGVALSDVAQDRAEEEADHSEGCITSAAIRGTAGLWQVEADALRARCNVATRVRPAARRAA